MPTPLVIGIAGGTASGKTWLAAHLAQALGPARCVVLAHDWYYRDHPGLTAAARSRLDYDRPDALDNTLLLSHLRALRAGRAIAAPGYDYARHRRTARTTPVAPAPIILLEGLFVLAEARLRRALDLKVFVHAPADVRLLRRIRRDTSERGQPLAEVLSRYETQARPGHDRFVQPSARHSDLHWAQTNDAGWPERLLAELKKRS